MTGRSEPRSARKSQLSAIPQRNADADGRRPVWNSERQPTNRPLDRREQSMGRADHEQDWFTMACSYSVRTCASQIENWAALVLRLCGWEICG